MIQEAMVTRRNPGSDGPIVIDVSRGTPALGETGGMAGMD